MPDFETIRDARNELIRAHLHFAILFDSVDNAAVATLEDDVTGELEIPATAESAGTIEKKAGVDLTNDVESTEVEGYGDAEPVRTIISKRTVQFEATFLETRRVVLEKYWGTYFDDSNLDISEFGGTTIKAPNLPKNLFYRAYLVTTDTDGDGDEIVAYYIMPRVQLVDVGSQKSQDNEALVYTMTFRATRDRVMGFSVLQGWCGRGWLKLIDKTGFVAPLASISATPATASIDISDAEDQQITVTGNNNLNYTPLCTFVSSAPDKATVTADGLVEPVAAGSATITVSYGALTDTVAITVTA